MVILHKQYGRLGNHLLQYAQLLSNQQEHKYTLINPHFINYSNNFEKRSKFVFFKKFFKKIIYYLVVFLKKAGLYKSFFHEIIIADDENNIIDINDINIVRKFKKKIIFLEGWWWRDYKNITKHHKYIKEFFKPNIYYLNKINLLLTKENPNDIFIGIHIRRGDYRVAFEGKYFYTDEVYLKIITNLQQIMKKNLIFVICSDEEIKKKKFAEFNVIYPEGNTITDLYTLASCNYLVGAPSTFIAWASLYSQTPLYFIENPNKEISLSDFKIYNINE